MELLRKTIRPEFLNRVDEIIMFTPLTHDEIREIVKLQIDRIREMMKEKDIDIVVDDEVLDWIAKVGFDPVYGARPIKRVIQRELVNELSKAIIAGTIDKDTVIHVSVSDDHMVFTNT
jgi:ATP-dependent Clp protease ATP-binding subunit ClpB